MVGTWTDRTKPWIRRLRRLADLFPLSAGGFLLLVVLGLGFWFLGLRKADMVLLLATGCMLVVALLSILVVSGCALLTRSRWRKTQQPLGGLRLEVGARCWTGFSFRPVRFPFVETRWNWLEPRPAGVECRPKEGSLYEEVVPGRRGLAERILRCIEIRDVLGVSSIRWSGEQPAAVQILPLRVPLDESTLIQSFFEGDDFPDPAGDLRGDRVDMRRYTAGDPPRLILWKVYARTRKLMVRVPERALAPQPRTCAYFVAGEGDEPCAAVTRTILERNLLGSGWRFGADGSAETASEPESALKILCRSGNPREGTGGLTRYLEAARTDGYQSCLVVVPPVRGPWLREVKAMVRQSPMRLTLLTVGRSSERARPRWMELVLYSEDVRMEDPQTLFQELRTGDRKFLLYDLESGTVLPDYRYQRIREQVKSRS